MKEEALYMPRDSPGMKACTNCDAFRGLCFYTCFWWLGGMLTQCLSVSRNLSYTGMENKNMKARSLLSHRYTLTLKWEPPTKWNAWFNQLPWNWHCLFFFWKASLFLWPAEQALVSGVGLSWYQESGSFLGHYFFLALGKLETQQLRLIKNDWYKVTSAESSMGSYEYHTISSGVGIDRTKIVLAWLGWKLQLVPVMDVKEGWCFSFCFFCGILCFSSMLQ